MNPVWVESFKKPEAGRGSVPWRKSMGNRERIQIEKGEELLPPPSNWSSEVIARP